VTRKTSFYYSFLVLPAPQRKAITAVFDFCRAVDDAVDEAPDPNTAAAEVVKWRGEVSYHKPAAELVKVPQTLIEYSWNHTTLNALKVDPTLTFTQLRFDAAQHREQVRAVYDALHPELMLHLEFIRDAAGLTTCSSLPLIRYTTEARLHEIHDIVRGLGVAVANPHTNAVGLGNKKALTREFFAAKRRFDPHDLMNPGKLDRTNEHAIV